MLRRVTPSVIDNAIAAIVRNDESTSNEFVTVVVGCGPSYTIACRALSIPWPGRILNHDLDFWDADAVMNWLWYRMLNHLETTNTALVEPAIAIFNAVDEGEFHHANDAAHVDPSRSTPFLSYKPPLQKLECGSDRITHWSCCTPCFS